MDETINQRDRVERFCLNGRCCPRRPAFVNCFGGLAPAGLVSALTIQASDVAFSGLILVDEIDPVIGHFRELHLIGIAPLACAGEVTSEFVLEGAALGQEALVGERAAA